MKKGLIQDNNAKKQLHTEQTTGKQLLPTKTSKPRKLRIHTLNGYIKMMCRFDSDRGSVR